MLLPFIGVIVFTGIYPKPMLERIEPAVDRLHRPRGGQGRLRVAEADGVDRGRAATTSREASAEADH